MRYVITDRNRAWDALARCAGAGGKKRTALAKKRLYAALHAPWNGWYNSENSPLSSDVRWLEREVER